MTHLLDFANYALFFYYLAGNLIYLTALLIALKTTAAHQRQVRAVHAARLRR